MPAEMTRPPTDFEIKVTKGLCNFNGDCKCLAFNRFDADTCQDVLHMARCAIRAGREPTPEMTGAGCSEMRSDAPTVGAVIERQKNAWRSMVDAGSPEIV